MMGRRPVVRRPQRRACWLLAQIGQQHFGEAARCAILDAAGRRLPVQATENRQATRTTQLEVDVAGNSNGAAHGPDKERWQPALAADEVQRIRQQWGPVVLAVATAAQGNQEVAEELGPFLDRMGQQPQWQGLLAVLHRILAGERDPQALLPGLDPTDTLIAGDVLQALGAEVAAAEQAPPASPEQLIDLVGAACLPDAPAGLGEGLFDLTSRLAADPDAPLPLRRLGHALNHVLAGGREPDLAGLPEPWARQVQAMVAALE